MGFDRWSDADLSLAISLWGDPRVTALIDARSTLNECEVRDRLESEIALFATHGVQYFPIFLLEGETFVGCCGLRPYLKAPGTLEVGVHVRPDFWRRGIAFEASNAMIEFAFRTTDAGVVMMGHHPTNAPSRALIEKLGFELSHTERYEATGLDHPAYMKHRPSAP